MLILLTVLFFALTLWLLFSIYEDVAILPGVVFFVLFIISIITGSGIVKGRVLDDKIAMYIEENQNIEIQMNALVEQYMNYESGTYGELKGESSITLVSLYPELKADTLVAKQIEVYIDNNAKIKELKEKKIDLSAKKWWLYFGK